MAHSHLLDESREAVSGDCPVGGGQNAGSDLDDNATTFSYGFSERHGGGGYPETSDRPTAKDPNSLGRPSPNKRPEAGSTILTEMLTPEITMQAFTEVPFPVATRDELRRKGMVKAEAMGTQLCVVWNNGSPRVFADSCPHLGLPLTYGKLDGQRLRCAYHGWTFDTDSSEVVEQPTLRRPQPCSLKRFGCLVAGGLVFSWIGDPEATEVARAMLPEEVIDDFSVFRVTFETPFYLALFSSVGRR